MVTPMIVSWNRPLLPCFRSPLAFLRTVPGRQLLHLLHLLHLLVGHGSVSLMLAHFATQEQAEQVEQVDWVAFRCPGRFSRYGQPSGNWSKWWTSRGNCRLLVGVPDTMQKQDKE